MRVKMKWGVIDNDLMGPAGRVARNMRTIMRAYERNARAVTPVSSGYMKSAWSYERRPNLDPMTMTFRLFNEADYAAARIDGVRPKFTGQTGMAVGLTQVAGNPLPGPNRGVTWSNYRAGYPGLDIFNIALAITKLQQRL